MKRKTLLCLIMLSGFLASCNKTPEARTPPPVKIWTLPVINIHIGAPLEYTSVGSVISDQRINISSKVTGYILNIPVREGDKVQHGQILARIDGSDIEGRILQSEAVVASAETMFRNAKIDLDRFQPLFERGNMSDYEFRKVRVKFDATRETLNNARAGLDISLAQRAYTEIRSPANGVVVTRVKRAGDLAVPAATILVLESGRLLFETFVEESRLSTIAVGKQVDVKIDTLTVPLKGTVSRVVPSGDPVTRSYQVKIALPETTGLMPGMFGRAGFMIGESKLPLVPRLALVERGGLHGVFVVDNNNLAHFRWLRIGREWPDQVEVTAGLNSNERLVAASEPALRDGDRISVQVSTRE